MAVHENHGVPVFRHERVEFTCRATTEGTLVVRELYNGYLRSTCTDPVAAAPVLLPRPDLVRRMRINGAAEQLKSTPTGCSESSGGHDDEDQIYQPVTRTVHVLWSSAAARMHGGGAAVAEGMATAAPPPSTYWHSQVKRPQSQMWLQH